MEDGEILHLAREVTGAEAAMIDPDRVVVSEAVAMKCRYGCSSYGRWLTCPPHSPPPDKTKLLLGEYHRAVLVRFSADAADKNQPIMKRPQRLMAELEAKLMKRGSYKALALAMGRCFQCDQCVLSAGDCPHPDVARPSMEACGIDVFATAKRAGLEVRLLEDNVDVVDLVGMVLVD